MKKTTNLSHCYAWANKRKLQTRENLIPCCTTSVYWRMSTWVTCYESLMWNIKLYSKGRLFHLNSSFTLNTHSQSQLISRYIGMEYNKCEEQERCYFRVKSSEGQLLNSLSIHLNSHSTKIKSSNSSDINLNTVVWRYTKWVPKKSLFKNIVAFVKS